MVPVSSSRRSARVDLPWSTWLMMEKVLVSSRSNLEKSRGSDFEVEFKLDGEDAACNRGIDVERCRIEDELDEAVELDPDG